MFSCFRGYQLHNPFHTIWATKIGNNLAVSFCIRVYSSSVLAILQDRLFEILRDQPPKMANFFPSVLPKKNAQIRCRGVLLTDTRVSRQRYLGPPSQYPVFLNSHTNSVLLHSRKRLAPRTDTIFASRGCPLTSASTVYAFMGVWGKRQRRCLFLTFSVRLHYCSGSLCISLLPVSLCHGVQSILEHPG